MKKILIVEDVDMNRDVLVQLLEDRYQLVEAVDGREGLARAAAEFPDLMLLDISLPDMDGLEVVRALRADPALCRIPVVAVTAHALRGDRERVVAAGCDACLTKPVDENELWAMVERYLQ